VNKADKVPAAGAPPADRPAPAIRSEIASEERSSEGIRRLGDFTTGPRVLLISAIAVLVGTAGMISGVILLELIRLFTNLSYFGLFSTTVRPFVDSPLGILRVLVPIGGSLIVGLMARYGTEQIRGHGIPEAIEAILLGRSRLNLKVTILKPLSSAIAIGTGGPFGAEGPIIMTGGALGSLIAQMLPVSDTERKTLLVAGAAAGMTTVFGTPIAAVLLAVELLLFEWSPRSFIPVATACIIAEVERTWVGLPSPLFPFDGSMAISFLGLGSWIFVGLLSGLLSGVLTWLVYACEDGFLKLPIHWMWWPLLGGLVVGIGGLIEPNALGVGYSNIAQMVAGHVLPAAAILLLVVKAIIWAVALGSGTSGGVLAPLLIMGGGLGAALAPFLPHASPGFWALLAMCATMGGTMRSPLTATFFAVEVTGNTHVLLPLIAACVTAHTVTVLIMRRSILTEKISRRGHHLTREYRIDPFALMQARDIMASQVESLPGTTTLREAIRLFTRPETKHPSFPVLDPQGRVLGIIDPPTLIAWRRLGRRREDTLAELLAAQDKRIALAYPDEYLEELIERMARANVAHTAVVSPTDQRLVGYVSWRDLLRARSRTKAEETQRVVFYRMRQADASKDGGGSPQQQDSELSESLQAEHDSSPDEPTERS
jgi:chloride channel protein, CIC family